MDCFKSSFHHAHGCVYFVGSCSLFWIRNITFIKHLHCMPDAPCNTPTTKFMILHYRPNVALQVSLVNCLEMWFNQKACVKILRRLGLSGFQFTAFPFFFAILYTKMKQMLPLHEINTNNFPHKINFSLVYDLFKICQCMFLISSLSW